jgi:hypothetical protein
MWVWESLRDGLQNAGSHRPVDTKRVDSFRFLQESQFLVVRTCDSTLLDSFANTPQNNHLLLVLPMQQAFENSSTGRLPIGETKLSQPVSVVPLETAIEIYQL